MLSDIGRGRGRIGAIVPSSNRNLEPDFFLLAPAGVSVHFVRVPTGDTEALPDSQALQNYANTPIAQPARMLAEATVDVIAYGCTSATLSGSPEFDRTLAEKIRSVSGLPTITAASALLEALQDLRLSKVAFASPYVRELHERAIGFLQSCKLSVVSEADVGRELGNYEQQMTPSSVYHLACQADSPQAEVIVLSCTEMRSVEAIEALERDLGKPVITSNQALVYTCLKRLGIEAPEVSAGGRLFRQMHDASKRQSV